MKRLLVALLLVLPLVSWAGSLEELLANVRQVTFEGRRAGEGYFGADGSKLVFQSEREPGNPFYQIYLLDLASGDVRRVSTGLGKTTCSWIHPAGDRVIFASTHDDPKAAEKQRAELEQRASGQKRRYSWDYDPEYELYERHLGTGELRRLTHAVGYDAEGSLSPDGEWVVFASNRAAYPSGVGNDPSVAMDLYLMRLDGTGLRRLTDAPGYDGGPFFSPDGRAIVWRRFSLDGATAEVYTMDLDTGAERKVTSLGAMSWAPFYHPSGDYLIFTTNLHGFANFELYLVDVRGAGQPVRVTHTDGFDGLPVFAPDGRRLAWTSNRSPDGTSQIFFADWDHAAARRLLGLDGHSDDIRAGDLRRHVEVLAAPEMEGRMTGSAGERKATAYVAAAFEAMGLEPAGDGGTFFEEFPFTAGVSEGPGNRLALDGRPVPREEWLPLAFSGTGEFPESEVVFAGYGLVAPEAEGQDAYDSYVHLDVKDRWVLAFRYLPEGVDDERRRHLRRYSSLRYKAMAARDHGARGLILVSGPRSGVKDQLVRLASDATLAGTSIAVLSVADAVGARMLEGSGKTLEGLQRELDTGKLSMGFALPARAAATVDLVQEKRTGRNVLARLPAPGGPPLVIGAHIDHLGRGEAGDSLAKEEEKGQIHFGADDNASGVAGVLEIAKQLVHQVRQGQLQPRRDVVFAAWSGEELGTLGSSHHVKSIQGRPASAYLNMDMIGRLEDALVLQGIGSSSVWRGEVERRNAVVGLPVVTQDESYLPTDATPFYIAGVPVLSAFTGAHADYHTPRDTAEKLDYEGAARIVRLLALVARGLAASAEEPDYRSMEKPAHQGERAGLRAYLGTIPDYSAGDLKGLLLAGVAKGGPADRAGLQAGDLIVGLAGRAIENIYDYTYAIDALRIGEPSEVVVERAGTRLNLTIVPESRD